MPVPKPRTVDALRRRPPGDRLLVYLDQSTLSALATEEAYAELRDLLLTEVEQGRVLCPDSLSHSGETLAASRSWKEILSLGDKLSMGISFLPDSEIMNREVHAAAAACSGDPPDELWREAFHQDPFASRERLYPGGFRVNAFFPPDEDRLGEVRRAKDVEALMEPVYELVRRLSRTFEEQAEIEYQETVFGAVGPIADAARFRGQMESTVTEIASGSPSLDRFTTLSMRMRQTQNLLERYPALIGRELEFADSAELRAMPALRYPALYRAGLATMAGRRPKRGDGYDIAHLMKGLSRCDIVTADSGMTQLSIDRSLVPSDVRLFRYNEVAGLYEAIMGELSERT